MPRQHRLLAPVLPLLTLALLATSLSACLPHPLKPVELKKGSETDVQLELTVNKDVDVLFVMDNSGSMGEEQAILASNFGTFIERLEAPGVEANYRLGVTTTDNGNEWCPAGLTTPEKGRLVMSSCKSRLNDFIFTGSPMVDAQDTACNDICNLDTDQLEILPTTTDLDANAKPRPWLENLEGRKNIPEDTDTVEAFKCFGPQGINGCGFESQLESMYLSLYRAQESSEESYGFMRDDAILAVVFVTDEADCSANNDFSEIFSADGNQVFWSDPNSPTPTSAVCWNAGVECTGDPSGYDDCVSVNKDVNGNSGVDDSEAVLLPMNRYTGLLDGIEASKQKLNPSAEVIVSLIGGVASDGQPHYSDATNTDPDFQDKFGIGAGCQSANPDNPDDPIQAVPPVRLRELVDTYSPGNMFSVCEPQYDDALNAIGAAIANQIRPACYSECVKDTDAATLVVDPECTVEQDPPGDTTPAETLEECLRDASTGEYVVDADTDNYAMPSADVNVCYAVLTDSSDPSEALTSSTLDDMSEECDMDNFNLEFKITRRPGFPAPGGTSISATCSLADFPEVECPGIGGV